MRSNSQAFQDSGSNTFTYQATVSAGTTPGQKSLPVTVSDNLMRSSTTSIALTVQSPPPPTTVKISQVYGGGGNSGATYTNDFIELFNRGQQPIDLSHWFLRSGNFSAALLFGRPSEAGIVRVWMCRQERRGSPAV